MRTSIKIVNKFCQHKQPLRHIIVPQVFTKEPFDHYQLINSNSFSFLIEQDPPQNISEIYQYFSDTPSNLLKKEGIHIFPSSMPKINIQEKYTAHLKKLSKLYTKAYDKCKTPAELFHMERRIKSQIRKKCKFIGQITSRYKHYNVFQSMNQIKAEKTAEEYIKKGITVNSLPFSSQDKKIIYPKGPIWLPTNQDYLSMFVEYVHKSSILYKLDRGNILDIGTGSGVLSYILGHKFKSKDVMIYALDNNPKAVETCEINAASFGLKNIYAFQGDITKQNSAFHDLKINKAPTSYDVIICNPPWIHAKKQKKQSDILSGVYDEKGKVISSVLESCKTLLLNQSSRLILIYSDLSQILGLQKKSIAELCRQNNLIIHEKIEIGYSKNFDKNSVLNPFKQKAKIQLYEIGKS